MRTFVLKTRLLVLTLLVVALGCGGLSSASVGASTALPRDGLLVFSCANCPRAEIGARLFTMRPDGTRLRVMGPENAYYPRWSPDGRTIAFTHKFEELWLSGRHGSGLRRLSGPEAGDDGSPAWSPDGRRLVFVRAVPPPPGTAGSYRTSLWTIGTDGSRPGRFLFSAPRNVVWPEWSPDGRWIAFAVAPPERLWVANADGSQRRRLGPKPLVGQEPRWSPDGTRIAFRSETGAAIRVLDLRSNGIRTVARGTTAAYAWSPDGRRLAVLGATLRECRSGRRCMWLRIVDLASLRTRSAYLLDRAPEIYGLDWRRSP